MLLPWCHFVLTCTELNTLVENARAVRSGLHWRRPPTRARVRQPTSNHTSLVAAQACSWATLNHAFSVDTVSAVRNAGPHHSIQAC